MVQGQVTVVSNAAFTRHGTNLYAVGGGFTREIPNKNTFYSGPETTVGDGQLIVLDLSTPWDGASPPWKKLANGPKQYNLPAALNADGTKLVAFHGSAAANNTFGMIYDVAAGTWSNSTVVVPNPNREGIPGVTDPDNDIMYLATGYDANNKGDQMYTYNFTSDKMFTQPMNGQAIMGLAYFAGAWNSKTKSIMYFGGNIVSSGDNAPSGVTTYTPSTSTWASLVTTGPAPSGRSDMCLAVSDDGTKLIVHGGRTRSQFNQWLSGEIFILDLNTNKWTQGRSYVKPRLNPVCTLINGTFISWGGSDDGQNVGNQAIVYDLQRNKYLSKYMGPDPDSDYDPLVGNQKDKTLSGSNSNSDSDSGPGGMIGGIVAAVVVLGGLAFYVRWKLVNRHLNQRQQVINMLEQHQNNANKPNNGSVRPGATGTGAAGSTGARPISQKPLPQPIVSHNRVSVTPISTVTMVEPSRTGGYQHYQYTTPSAPTQVPLPYPQTGSSSPYQSQSLLPPAQSPLPYPQMAGSPSPFQQHAHVAPSSPIPALSMQKQEDIMFSLPPQYEFHPTTARARGPEHIPDFPNS
ncbi:hypothetical protein CPC16_011232 [Podila verticillata]|nr:hypothetical protein BGZ59_010482 [Podila verticillata]KAF9378544.1 hypothetical protein CPC16_011232 [Podila verticillata]